MYVYTKTEVNEIISYWKDHDFAIKKIIMKEIKR